MAGVANDSSIETTVRVDVTLSPDASMPRYQSSNAAGMDLCTAVDFELEPLERKLVPTGVRMAIPHGFEGQVRPRSGLALRHGIALVNSPGTIDSDYRGEVGLILINLSSERVKFSRGDRIGQIVICPVTRAELHQVEELESTERGEGGFGSTGKK